MKNKTLNLTSLVDVIMLTSSLYVVHTHYSGHFSAFTEGLHSKGMRYVVHGDGVDLNDAIILTGQ